MIKLPVSVVLGLGVLGVVLNNYAFLHDLLWGKGTITMGFESSALAVLGAALAVLSLITLLALLDSHMVAPLHFDPARKLRRRQDTLDKTLNDVKQYFAETEDQTRKLADMITVAEAELAEIQAAEARLSKADS